MAKLIQFKQQEQDGDDLFVVLLGTVAAIREGSGAATGQVTNITLEGMEWDKAQKKEVTKKLDVAFWNSNKEGGAQLSDRIGKAKVNVGSIIAVRGFMDKEEKQVRAFDFMYQGSWTIKRENEGKLDLNFFLGTVIPSQFKNEGRFHVSVPTEEWNAEKEERETVWNNITFWNNENQQNATNAELILTPSSDGKYKRAGIITGEAKPYLDKEGNERVSYSGFNFDVIYTKGNKDAGDKPATVAEIAEEEPAGNDDFFQIEGFDVDAMFQ